MTSAESAPTSADARVHSRADGNAHPIAIIPAAIVSLGAVFLFGLMIQIPGYLLLVAGVLGAVWTDRRGLSHRLGADLAVIAIALSIISTVSLKADISWWGIVRFGVVLGLAVIVPYVITRYVYKERSIQYPWSLGRWSPRMWWYFVIVIFAAYLILPFYFLTSGVYLNWPAVEGWSEITRLFVGVNAVGLWDELFFICTVFTLLLRHFRPWVANLLQAAIFVSFLWELGYQSWGPLLTIPFALVQGAIFSWTKNLLYVVLVHLLFDAVVFLVIVHAHYPDALPIFPLVHGF